MKILILNGNSKQENIEFDNYLERLRSLLEHSGHTAEVLQLRNKKINYCIGCYTCWLKTPGVCVFKDDGAETLQKYINADFVLFTSPIIMGFVSALLKNVQDRSLPLVHPYLHVVNDRCQHLPRYDKYPSTSLLLDSAAGCDKTNMEIIDKVFKSAKSRKLYFTKTMETRVEEIAYEINNI